MTKLWGELVMSWGMASWGMARRCAWARSMVQEPTVGVNSIRRGYLVQGVLWSAWAPMAFASASDMYFPALVVP